MRVKIKICGITSPETAVACLEAGADMIGLVYYPPSPRHIDAAQVTKILDAAEPFRQKGCKTVLVTADQVPEVLYARFDYVQSYGSFLYDVPIKQIRVIRDFVTFHHYLELPKEIEADYPLYVLEMSKGCLPGGNGAVWDWSIAAPFCKRYPTLIAGGVSLENVAEVIRKAKPFGVDVSSGVESAPGIKDIGKVKRLIKALTKP